MDESSLISKKQTVSPIWLYHLLIIYFREDSTATVVKEANSQIKT
jgi:hypothetical protein